MKKFIFSICILIMTNLLCYASNTCITVPKDATLFVGEKNNHFVNFTKIEETSVIEDENNKMYYFDLVDDKTYNYRISGEEFITHAGTFVKTPDFNLQITPEDLMFESKNRTDRNPSSNNGYNVGDIYLNINPKGHLRLEQIGDAYQIVNIRNWQAIDSITNNYFIEPDFHYTVIDEYGQESDDVIQIDKNGLITANGEGVSIVLVTYDALDYTNGEGGPFFGAIWQENTGVFVVTVGGQQSDNANLTIHKGKNNSSTKLSGDNIDAEFDVIYFTGEEGVFEFEPDTDGYTVFVNNPTINDTLTYAGFIEVEESANSFKIPLKHGRNIVKIEKDGKTDYQVITAKRVNITINNGEAVYPGDEVKIVFDTLYHPVNKLAGIYNMSAVPIYQSSSCVDFEGKIIGALPTQYDFASNESSQTVESIVKGVDQWGVISYEKDFALKIPVDYNNDTFTLTDGCFYVSGWGNPYGSHRYIDYENGADASFYIDARMALLGKLPDIEIPITKANANLVSISVDYENALTDYYVGDMFDASGLIVTSNYDDDTSWVVSNYTISPEILSADTESVVVTYKGMTALIPVNVSVPKVSEIKITSAPKNTEYMTGETFDPTGMVVTIKYENGTTVNTTDYSYSPNRVLEVTDTEITVTYTGEGAEQTLTDKTPITVSERTHNGEEDDREIIVELTLYGDTNHDENGVKHTLKDDNLTVWIPKTNLTLPRGSTLIQAVEKALAISGIPYSNPTGDYIENIKGLSEFDNGPMSGWMYTINGLHIETGISEQKVKDGDVIVFHFTDDYTRDSEGYGFGGDASWEDDYNQEETVTSTQSKPENDVKTEPVKYYNDTKGHWAEKEIEEITKLGFIKGTSDSEFSPDENLTRAMFVTILYRMNGETNTENANFEDVPYDAYYYSAVAWATRAGIVNGVSETNFAPDQNITREELATMLYRYANHKGYNTKVEFENLSYEDSKDISGWAYSAMVWAKDDGIINGKTKTLLAPKDTATRAETAMIISRFIKNQRGE